MELDLSGTASLLDFSVGVTLPAAAGRCSQHVQVAKSLQVMAAKVVALCMMFSPTTSCWLLSDKGM